MFWRTSVPAGFLAAIASLTVALPASALTVRKDGTTLRLSARSAEVNWVFISQIGTTITIDDTRRWLWSEPRNDPEAGAGCIENPVPGTEFLRAYSFVTCTSVGLSRVVVNLGGEESRLEARGGVGSTQEDPLRLPLTAIAGADNTHMYGTPAAPNRLESNGFGVTLVGGDHGDTLIGGPHGDLLGGGGGDDQLIGGGGNDMIWGEAGSDQLLGQEGDDTLSAEPGGPDVLDGGTGSDGCGFGDWITDGVAISLDGVANDGLRSTTPRGNVLACELLKGTVGPDVLIGSDRPERIQDFSYWEVTDDRQDEFDGRGGNDHLVSGGRDSVLMGGDGDDTIELSRGDENVSGGAGIDSVHYNTGADIVADLDGEVGDDGTEGERDTLGVDIENLSTGSGADQLTGNAADNILNGGAGADSFDGGGGSDTVPLDAFFEGVFADLSEGFAIGRENARWTRIPLVRVENVTGGPGYDTLIGNSENNRLDGAGADDWIDGGLGDDQIEGGWGDDTVSYEDRPDPVAVDLSTGTGGQAGERDRLVRMENVIGGSANDDIRGDAEVNLFDGGAGSDTIEGGGGPDVVSYENRTAPITVDLIAGLGGQPGEQDSLDSIWDVIGGEGDDLLRGDAADNILDGGDGSDTIDGRSGADEIFGGNDFDQIEARDALFDDIDCGEDGGLATVDARDSVSRCERRVLPLPTPTTPSAALPSPQAPESAPGVRLPRPTTAAPVTMPTVRLPTSVSRQALRQKRLSATVTCASPCTARIEGHLVPATLVFRPRTTELVTGSSRVSLVPRSIVSERLRSLRAIRVAVTVRLSTGQTVVKRGLIRVRAK